MCPPVRAPGILKNVQQEYIYNTYISYGCTLRLLLTGFNMLIAWKMGQESLNVLEILTIKNKRAQILFFFYKIMILPIK